VSAPKATLDTLIRNAFPLPPKPESVVRQEEFERAQVRHQLAALKAAEMNRLRRQVGSPPIQHTLHTAHPPHNRRSPQHTLPT
jgi:hypothetical protein